MDAQTYWLYRQRLGLTRAQLAKLVGLDRSTIYRREQGEVPIDREAELAITHPETTGQDQGGTMRYVTMTVVVDGALEEETDYFDYALLGEAVRYHAEQARADGIETEVYLLDHDHAPGDCECIQYETDHNPYFVFPRDDIPEPNFYA